MKQFFIKICDFSFLLLRIFFFSLVILLRFMKSFTIIKEVKMEPILHSAISYASSKNTYNYVLIKREI